MMIIENLLIFLIDPYSFQIQTGIFKYLKELDGGLLRT
jgi:hypothetical protein